MSTWPSGTIARATVRGVPDVLVMYHGNTWGWTSSVNAGGSLGHGDEQVTDVRPLVVLDPADARCPRLSDVIRGFLTYIGSASARRDLEWIADEIERQTKPPRMVEPGWGERVVASSGGCPREVWLRRADCLWEDASGALAPWADLIDPEPVGGESNG